MIFFPRRAFPRIALGSAGLLLALAAAACNKPPASSTASPQSGAKRYPLKGKVVSVDLASGTANVAAEAIPGFMDAMTMPYEVHPPTELGQLSPGDAIAAEVVVEDDKYWLENVRVTRARGRPSPETERRPRGSGARRPGTRFPLHQPERQAHFAAAISRPERS